MGKVKDSFLFHFNDLEIMEDMDDKEVGMIFRAIIQYAKDGTDPDIEDRFLKHCFKSLARRHDSDADAYNERCRKNSESARMRWNANASERTETHEKDMQSDAIYADMDMDTDMDTDTDSDMDMDMDTDIPRVPARVSVVPTDFIAGIKTRVVEDGDLTTLAKSTWIDPVKIQQDKGHIYISHPNIQAITHIRDRYGGFFKDAIRSVNPEFSGEVVFATG